MTRMVGEHVWMRNANGIMRFLCKEYWHYLFGKYVDRLQTNNKGTYVLYDHGFVWLPAWSHSDSEAVNRLTAFYFGFVEGIIEGGLHIFGFSVKAEGEMEEKGCKFTLTSEAFNLSSAWVCVWTFGLGFGDFGWGLLGVGGFRWEGWGGRWIRSGIGRFCRSSFDG